MAADVRPLEIALTFKYNHFCVYLFIDSSKVALRFKFDGL
jgi:hypothetical protein